MQTRMSTNAIVNTELFIRDKKNKPEKVNKTNSSGLLSRVSNDKIENDDPLPVQLKLMIREAFTDAG
tara:strand:+ start:1087 stop:1287 length:201 start_codon:yes stop_codon:yes gene_type:complete